MNNRSREGFTLVELLIVIAIIGILVAIAIPTLAGSRQRARTATCLANRRSLLAEVSMTAIFDEQEMGEAFETLYPTVKDEYTCPEGGVFSWVGQRIVCDKHPDAGSGDEQTPAVSVGGGLFQIQLDSGVDTVQYSQGDTVTVSKGKIFKVGDNYYIGRDNFSPRKMSGAGYETWLKSTYMVREVSFEKLYTQDDLGTNGLLNKYSSAPVGAGSVYSFGGKLYVQKVNFSGNTPKQSSDPTVNIDYWTLLGAIK